MERLIKPFFTLLRAMTTPRPRRLTKTKLLAAFVGLEILALPVAAKMVDKVEFEVPARVIVAEADLGIAGQSSYLVASNAPFVVEVEGVIGDVSVEVNASGQLGTLDYGSQAQLPGARQSCTTASRLVTRVYTSKRKTAESQGDITEQAVRVDVTYDTVAEPRIRIVPVDDGYALPGEPCSL